MINEEWKAWLVLLAIFVLGMGFGALTVAFAMRAS